MSKVTLHLVDEETKFDQMGLDARLLKAIAKCNYEHPTLIQSKAIPLALEGKDILAKARTGSGKTAAYLIPILEKILREKSLSRACSTKGILALILVPTKELCEQTRAYLKDLCYYCSREINALQLTSEVAINAQKIMLSEHPEILIATPSRLLVHLQSKNADLSNLRMLVIDEADLILSFGYEEDLRRVLDHLPKFFQSFLMSATMNEDIDKLKQLILHNPAILKLKEMDDDLNQRLMQYVIKCESNDKFLLLLFILKLNLLKGKLLIFVNEIDRCYKLKLFMEQFSIRACVLNSELPQNSRYHIVEEFNKGIYDVIVATDEKNFQDGVSSEEHLTNQTDNKNPPKITVSSSRNDKEYGITRGVDFKAVDVVVNFDMPRSTRSYVHRVGRTARVHAKGMALSFVAPEEYNIFEKINDEQINNDVEIKPFVFKMDEVEGFRYRVDDALRAVTKAAVREARLKEYKREILTSEKLKSHFEDNPKDLNALRHDRTLHPSRVQPHLKHIPDYLIPSKIVSISESDSKIEAPVSHRKSRTTLRKTFGQKRKTTSNDPLKTFSANKRR